MMRMEAVEREADGMPKKVHVVNDHNELDKWKDDTDVEEGSSPFSPSTPQGRSLTRLMSTLRRTSLHASEEESARPPAASPRVAVQNLFKHRSGGRGARKGSSSGSSSRA